MKEYICVLPNAPKDKFLMSELAEMGYTKADVECDGDDLVTYPSTEDTLLCKGHFYKTNIDQTKLQQTLNEIGGRVCYKDGKTVIIAKDIDTFLAVAAKSTLIDYGKWFIEQVPTMDPITGLWKRKDHGKWFRCENRFLNSVTDVHRIEAREATLIEILQKVFRNK